MGQARDRAAIFAAVQAGSRSRSLRVDDVLADGFDRDSVSFEVHHAGGRSPTLIRNWTLRGMNTALYWLNHPTNTTTSA